MLWLNTLNNWTNLVKTDLYIRLRDYEQNQTKFTEEECMQILREAEQS